MLVHDVLLVNIYLLTLFSQLVKLKTHPIVYRTIKFLVVVQIGFFIFALTQAQLDPLEWLYLSVRFLPLVFLFYIMTQTEMRLILSALKLDRVLRRKFSKDDRDMLIASIDALIAHRMGALITIERNDSLTEYMANATMIHAPIQKDLIVSIFNPKSPLHDGAIIIVDRMMLCAGAYYPTSESRSVPKALGSRHRAALGLSEITDALTIIVSEETGHVSITLNGKLDEDISQESLELYLNKYFDQ